MLAMVFASGRYWGNPMLFHDREIISNLFLVNQQQGIVTIDLVNWTLAIEMMFYGCAIILWPVVRRSSTLSLVGFAIFILALLNWIPPGSAMWDTTKYQLMMVSFLFIGTLFNFSLRGTISNTDLIGGVLFIGIAFAMMWQRTILAPQFWQVPANYAYALVVFSLCFILRGKFKPSKVLDFFADISFPLYLTHSIPGYVVIRILMAHGIRFSIAASIAFIFVVLVAYILHVGVELPTANLGKRLSRRQQDSSLPPKAA
jgi:peptidoglycan/LPS O-acetylase OafA/YrhL